MNHDRQLFLLMISFFFCFSLVLGEESVLKASKEIYKGETFGLIEAEKKIRKIEFFLDVLKKNTFITSEERDQFVRVSIEKDDAVDQLVEIITLHLLQQEIVSTDDSLGEKLKLLHSVLINLYVVKEEESKKALNEVSEGLKKINRIFQQQNSKVLTGPTLKDFTDSKENSAINSIQEESETDFSIVNERTKERARAIAIARARKRARARAKERVYALVKELDKQEDIEITDLESLKFDHIDKQGDS